MYRPLAVYIGLRYIRAKRSNHFISFISLTSMIGIALGVAVLITVLSVMNGFDDEIHDRFFGMTPEITIAAMSGKMADWSVWENKLKHYPGVKGIAPFVGGQGLLTFDGQVLPVLTAGVLPEEEQSVHNIASKMAAGKFDALRPGKFGIVLGKNIAMSLGVWLGDKVTLMIPELNISLAGAIPRFKRFEVVGIFSAGSGFNFDTRLSFIHLADAQKLFQMGNDVTGLRLKINNVYAAPLMGANMARELPENFEVSDWTDQFGAFFKAVKMEKTMMFLILMLIIAVAAFNLVSSLVMIVNDKQSEIAILKTAGARPSTILSIFMVQGMTVGLIGVISGVLLGIYLSWHATAIVDWLQRTLHVQWISSNVYFVDYLPSRLSWKDVAHVCLSAMLMSFAATIYPAWRASRVQPAEALRYE